jgi:hypothetical protein
MIASIVAGMLAAVPAAVPNAWSYVAAAYLLTFASILGLRHLGGGPGAQGGSAAPP